MLFGDAVTYHDDPIPILEEKLIAMGQRSYTRENGNCNRPTERGFHDRYLFGEILG